MQSSVFISVLLLSVVPSSHSRVTMYQEIFYDNPTYELPKTLAYLINKFLMRTSNGINIIRAAENVNQAQVQIDMLSGVLQHLEMTTTVSLSGFWVPWQSTFIIADTYSSFREALFAIRNDQYENTGYFLVFYTLFLNRPDTHNTFMDIYRQNIINIGVISARDELIILETYYPFTSNLCFNYYPSKSRTATCLYIDHKFYVKGGTECVLYPEKLYDFKGCPLVADAYDLPPYFIIAQNGISFSGLEYEILNALANKLNFKIRFQISDNRTLDRVKQFTLGSAHLAIGGLRATTISRKNVSSSIEYYKSKLVFVTRSGRPLSSVERLFSTANADAWVFLSIFSCTLFIAIIVLDRRFPVARNFIFGVENHDPLYWAWVASIGGAVNYNLRRNFARYILLQWIILNFLIRSGYQAFIYKSIRMDWKENSPSNIDEIIANGYTLMGSEETYHRMLSINNLAENMSVYLGSELEALHELETYDRKFAVIVSDMTFRYYMHNTKYSNLIMLREPLLEQMICIHFQRNSFLKAAFDRVLMQLRVSGLLTHWKMTYLPRNKRNMDSTMEPQSLKMADVRGHFQVFSFMIVSSCFVFAIELISVRVRFLRRMLT